MFLTTSKKSDKACFPLFGCQPTYEETELVLLAVPWGVTASLGSGAEHGPALIAQSSSQMDFVSIEAKDIRSRGVFFKKAPAFLSQLNQETRNKARPVIALEDKAPGGSSPQLLQDINQACRQMVDWVYEETGKIHTAGKLFGLVGGDHSTSEGALRFMGEKYQGGFGILHIDAHADLRACYQGFQHSHASVMRNILEQSSPPKTLVQVGVRDYCQEELTYIQSHKNIHTHFDTQIKTRLFEGQSWKSIVETILEPLPHKVYISLDVDGLSPELFPHTGTPVPGGLSFEQTWYLLSQLFQSKRHIIGFDLVEIADPFKTHLLKGESPLCDGFHGARLLYILCQQWLNSLS